MIFGRSALVLVTEVVGIGRHLPGPRGSGKGITEEQLTLMQRESVVWTESLRS